MSGPTPEAYEAAAARLALTDALAPLALLHQWDYAPAEQQIREAARAMVDAVWPLAVAATAEAIAQEIELADGERCPECRGKPASLKWKRGSLVRLGRCGAGHSWEHRWSGGYPGPAAISRALAAQIAEGTTDA